MLTFIELFTFVYYNWYIGKLEITWNGIKWKTKNITRSLIKLQQKNKNYHTVVYITQTETSLKESKLTSLRGYLQDTNSYNKLLKCVYFVDHYLSFFLFSCSLHRLSFDLWCLFPLSCIQTYHICYILSSNPIRYITLHAEQ